MTHKPEQKVAKRMKKEDAVRHSDRQYEADVLSIQSLRLIAAPDPKDDLSEAELETLSRAPGQSSEMIRYLIDFVKKL